MEFTSKEDIEAPIEKVFAVLSDVESLERQALRRGIEVRRTSSHPTAAEGMSWSAAFTFRGRQMQADITLRKFTPPEVLIFDGAVGGLATDFEIDLTALSPNRTRLTVRAKMLPKTLSARLLVQSLKLAKGRVTRKFSVRVAQFSRTLEERALKAA